MSRIACPYCCTVQTFPETNECRQCRNPVPEKYIRASRDTPPIYMVVVGMTAHGKTTFIHSLTYAMDNLGKVARGSFLDALDDGTMTQLRQIRGQIETREQTESTQKRDRDFDLQEPLVFSLKGFMSTPKHDRYPLVIYDLAGESFSDRGEIQQYAEPLKLARTIWFIVSLHDLMHTNDEYGTIADLFNIYITGMERVEASPRHRALHVVYTKADKLINQLPPEILSYIREDPYGSLPRQHPRELRDKQFDEDVYSIDLEEMSARLRDFTEYEVPSGMSFINMAEDYDMSLSFSINTATGGDYTPSMAEYESYRVLDPLVWALRHRMDDELVEVDEVASVPGRHTPTRSTSSEREVVLILDTGFASRQTIYNLQLPSLFFNELSRYGTVNTYYMGTLKPMARSGYEPSDNIPQNETLPFIGAILDQVGDNVMGVIITRQVIWDLEDFHDASWHERLGIVTMQNPVEVRYGDPWPRSAILTRGPGTPDLKDEVKQIVKKFFEAPL